MALAKLSQDGVRLMNIATVILEAAAAESQFILEIKNCIIGITMTDSTNKY